MEENIEEQNNEQEDQSNLVIDMEYCNEAFTMPEFEFVL